MAKDGRPSNLPLLYNPLLNCIFNNPNHSRAPYKQIIHELASRHTDFTIIVPPSSLLHNSYDPESLKSSSKIALHDLAYHNEEFIRSHIVKTGSNSHAFLAPVAKVQLAIYNTICGKQILVKNGMIFTGKGFRRSLRAKITDIGYFYSFCDYFPSGSKFMLIYIDNSLYGSSDHPEPALEASPKAQQAKIKRPDQVPTESITFERLLRNFPLLSKSVSDPFYQLFHHNNYQFRVLRTNTHKKLSVIKLEFDNMLEEAYQIILNSVKSDSPDGEQTNNLLHQILRSYPELDLNKLVHEYVEINLYDKLWAQLIFQFSANAGLADPDATKIFTAEKYDELSCLSLNQLDIPVDEPWLLNDLLLRVYNAIIELSKLADATIIELSSKLKIISNTISILTENSNSSLMIDADTLIGLLIMVVVHSKIDFIEAHLYYIKNFMYGTISDDGYLSFIISSFDAVFFHLSHPDEPQYADMKESSQKNFEFWSLIRSHKVDEITALLEETDKLYGDKLPHNHFLKARNINGESALMLAIRSKNYDTFLLLLSRNPNWFSIEDILFDRNTTTSQNLLMVSLMEETKIITKILIEILGSCTLEEQIAYINSTDYSGRSVGHYLFHDYELINEVGHLVNWELKDHNSYTPLFNICRCYDHYAYYDLIKTAFSAVMLPNFNFKKHTDKYGNSILHILLKGIDQSGLLKADKNINVNCTNSKCLTPLTVYVKYGRIENLISLLQDKRLEFMFEDKKNFFNIFDYVAFSSRKQGDNDRGNLEEITSFIYSHYFKHFIPLKCTTVAFNAKFDTTKKDWIVYFHGNQNIILGLDLIKQLHHSFKLKNPHSLIPDVEKVWLNYPANGSVAPIFAKFRMNRLLENLNIFLVCLSMHPNFDTAPHETLGLSSSGNSLSLDQMKEVIGKQESLSKVTPHQLAEIETFLSLLKENLLGTLSTTIKFNKLMTVMNIKMGDLNTIREDSLYLAKMLCDMTPLIKTNYHTPDYGYRTMFQYFIWVELTLIEIIRNVNKVLGRITDWRQCHDRVLLLAGELRKYEDKRHELGTDEHSNSSWFGNIIENKRTRYKKLVLLHSEETKKLGLLSNEIKISHEDIAAEMSHYLMFRSKLIPFAIKQFTRVATTGLNQNGLHVLQ